MNRENSSSDSPEDSSATLRGRKRIQRSDLYAFRAMFEPEMDLYRALAEVREAYRDAQDRWWATAQIHYLITLIWVGFYLALSHRGIYGWLALAVAGSALIIAGVSTLNVRRYRSKDKAAAREQDCLVALAHERAVTSILNHAATPDDLT